MSGHSKWSTIKRQKGVADAKRSAVFTKLARQISVAAKNGPDPDMNFKLRLAIDKAKAASMPKDNIDRAIKAGSGTGKEDLVKEAVYEGFGPGQVAIVVQAATDNPNRTSAEIRNLFSKFGGNLGTPNSVSWMFALRGLIRVSEAKIPAADREQLELDLIDGGAQDVRQADGVWTVETEPNDLQAVQKILTDRKIEAEEAGLELVPNTTASIDDGTREKLFGLFDALEEHPDVDSFSSNEL